MCMRHTKCKIIGGHPVNSSSKAVTPLLWRGRNNGERRGREEKRGPGITACVQHAFILTCSLFPVCTHCARRTSQGNGPNICPLAHRTKLSKDDRK